MEQASCLWLNFSNNIAIETPSVKRSELIRNQGSSGTTEVARVELYFEIATVSQLNIHHWEGKIREKSTWCSGSWWASRRFSHTPYQEPTYLHSDCRKDHLNKSLINIQQSHHISSSKQRVKDSEQLQASHRQFWLERYAEPMLADKGMTFYDAEDDDLILRLFHFAATDLTTQASPPWEQ